MVELTNSLATPVAEATTETHYKRDLPNSSCVSFSSKKGKLLFKQGLMAGTMENYFSLAEQFTTQQDPAYCGPASLTMFLNSVQVDPNKTWKGVWRWYSEEILHCTTHEFLQYGITLEEITQLARCNGLHTMTFKPKDDDPLLHEKIVDNAVEHDHTEPLYTTGTCCSTTSPLKKQSQ